MSACLFRACIRSKHVFVDVVGQIGCHFAVCGSSDKWEVENNTRNEVEKLGGAERF